MPGLFFEMQQAPVSPEASFVQDVKETNYTCSIISDYSICTCRYKQKKTVQRSRVSSQEALSDIIQFPCMSAATASSFDHVCGLADICCICNSDDNSDL